MKILLLSAYFVFGSFFQQDGTTSATAAKKTDKTTTVHPQVSATAHSAVSATYAQPPAAGQKGTRAVNAAPSATSATKTK